MKYVFFVTPIDRKKKILLVGFFLMVVLYTTLPTVVWILTAFSGTLPEMVRANQSEINIVVIYEGLLANIYSQSCYLFDLTTLA